MFCGCWVSDGYILLEMLHSFFFFFFFFFVFGSIYSVKVEPVELPQKLFEFGQIVFLLQWLKVTYIALGYFNLWL